MIMLTADRGVETYAVGSQFVVDSVTYRIKDEDAKEVQAVGPENKATLVNLTIPTTVEDADGVEWKVTTVIGFADCEKLESVQIGEGITRIGDSAFRSCGMLESVQLPESVTEIGNSAFEDNQKLAAVNLPGNLISIGTAAFFQCRVLTGITLPSQVTSIKERVFSGCRSLDSINLENVRQIESAAFSDCTSLNNISLPDQLESLGFSAFAGCKGLTSDIVIPGSVSQIGGQAFWNCTGLTKVTISAGVTNIDVRAFKNCSSLQVLNIAVGDTAAAIAIADSDVFADCPSGRYIVFMNADGTAELTGAELEAVKQTYLASTGGDSTQGTWYGWQVDKPITYPVIVDVRKDDAAWNDHGKKFALSADGGNSFVTDLNAVMAGEYNLYDVTDDRDKLDTEISLTVDGVDDNATVDYYTVRFYDEGVLYGDDTDQKQQNILKTVGRVRRPQTNPVKNGALFYKWMSADKKTEFNFDMTAIDTPTDIYATWTVNTADSHTVIIHVLRNGLEWTDHGRAFALLANGGAEFITDFTQVKNGTYNIYDITGVNPDSYWSKSVDTGIDVHVDGVDTEVTVTVLDADTEATVKYYTATFYDGTTAYGTGTPQEPQLILEGKFIRQPDAPDKAGHQFAGWKTQDGGSTEFDFGTAVTAAADIYASWTAVTGTVYSITAVAGTGGWINPSGYVTVNEGAEQSFAIMPNNGYRIKTVEVDGTDVTTAVTAANGVYTFNDVRGNHRIEANFETDGSSPDDGDNPGSGGNTGGSSGSGSGGSHGSGGTGNNAGSEGGDISYDTDNAGSFAGEVGNEEIGMDGSNHNESVIGNGSQTEGNRNISSEDGQDNNQNDTNLTEGKATGSEPKTGDTHQTEVYATIAMIAGLTYLLLYFTDKERGMTEKEKKEIVSMLVRWAKQGHYLRKYIAMAAIFCLLVYYHGIGKRICTTETELAL